MYLIALQKSFLIIFFRFSAFTIVKLQTVVLKELSRTETDENLRVQKVRGKKMLIIEQQQYLFVLRFALFVTHKFTTR